MSKTTLKRSKGKPSAYERGKKAGLQAAVVLVPGSWLDSLLTGPTAVIGKPPYGCPDIENLLRAVKKRIGGAT